MDYLPPKEEVKLLRRRHEELSASLIEDIVMVADAVRRSPELGAGLSVRATDEACIYLKHPLYAGDKTALADVLKASFCGRFSGRHDDVTTDAGAAWAVVKRALRERGAEVGDE